MADAAPDDTEVHSAALVSLSNWLSALGRREDALGAIEQAVTIHRQLAAAWPAVFAPRLKDSLTNMANVSRVAGQGR